MLYKLTCKTLPEDGELSLRELYISLHTVRIKLNKLVYIQILF